MHTYTMSDSDASVQSLYTVEKILDKRITEDGSVEYLIKWEGYDHSENTWEPLRHFEDPMLVEAFEREWRERNREEEKTTPAGEN